MRFVEILNSTHTNTCDLSYEKLNTTTIYEDNIACIAQLKDGYIKGDRTKHISPKFFFTHDLQKSGDISIQQICSCDNLVDFFTKSLPSKIFNQLVQKIGLHRRNDRSTERIHERILYSFSSLDFFPLDFFSKVLTRHILNGHSRGSVMNKDKSECSSLFFFSSSYSLLIVVVFHLS